MWTHLDVDVHTRDVQCRAVDQSPFEEDCGWCQSNNGPCAVCTDSSLFDMNVWLIDDKPENTSASTITKSVNLFSDMRWRTLVDARQDCSVRLANFAVGENAKSAEQVCTRLQSRKLQSIKYNDKKRKDTLVSEAQRQSDYSTVSPIQYPLPRRQ
jgi:hypothetical protein